MILLTFFAFIFGSILGSFVCVLVDRLPSGKSFLKGRSQCASCGHKLGVLDLIPVVSYSILSGKCRYCHAKIPSHVFIVELLSGIVSSLLFIYVVTYLSSIFLYFFLLVIFLCLIGVIFTDAFSGIIPDEFVVAITISSFLLLWISNPSALPLHILSSVAAFGFFLLLFLITRGRGMGFGDVKFAFSLGFFLGFPDIVVCLYFAFLTATAISLILILKGKKKLKGGSISFGPYLAIGAFFAFFATNWILSFIPL